MPNALWITNCLNRSVSKVADRRKRSGLVSSLVPGAILSLLLTTSQAQTNFQQILSFGALPQSGSSPRAQLMEGSDGWLYGLTYVGGTEGSGTIFKISKNGSGFVQIHSFTNGGYPLGGLVEASDGALCGRTSNSGADGSATVFKCNKDGSGFTLLHVFPPPGTTGDGTTPMGSLIRGNDGILYGATFGGGAANLGTVFGLSANGGNYTNLHSFAGGTDGSYPATGVCQGLDGALYGMTQGGGSNGYGTVFKLNPKTGGCMILHHFSGGTNDGWAGIGGLVQDSEGLLYGTTSLGGAENVGTMFRLDTNGGSYAVLRSFTLASEGMHLCANLVAGSNNVLYGATQYGGPDNIGTVFGVKGDGTGYALLHSFSALGGDGSEPLAPLLMGSDGALYGSTSLGGSYVTNGVYGTLFRMFASSPQLVPPVILSQTVIGGNFQVSFSGPDGQSYRVLATTDLSLPPASWTVLTNGTFAGPATFIDTPTAHNPARFYRVGSP